jgi:hypothetical protein
MKRIILLISIGLIGCSKKDVCIRCEKASIVYEFCDGDVDASVVAYNLTNQGFVCERY